MLCASAFHTDAIEMTFSTVCLMNPRKNSELQLINAAYLPGKQIHRNLQQICLPSFPVTERFRVLHIKEKEKRKKIHVFVRCMVGFAMHISVLNLSNLKFEQYLFPVDIILRLNSIYNLLWLVSVNYHFEILKCHLICLCLLIYSSPKVPARGIKRKRI